MIACIIALLGLSFISNEIFNLVCIGAVGFFASSIFSIIYSLALKAKPDKSNEISGLMITAIAGGGIVTPIMGIATTGFGIIGGILVILLCVLYLTYCAFSTCYSWWKVVTTACTTE